MYTFEIQPGLLTLAQLRKVARHRVTIEIFDQVVAAGGAGVADQILPERLHRAGFGVDMRHADRSGPFYVEAAQVILRVMAEHVGLVDIHPGLVLEAKSQVHGCPPVI